MKQTQKNFLIPKASGLSAGTGRASMCRMSHENLGMLEPDSRSMKDLARALGVLGSLYCPNEPLNREAASEVVSALYPVASDLFGKWLNQPEVFAAEWNSNAEHLMVPGAGFSLEESVHKPWTRDPSHPLAERMGFTRGDPAAHMAHTLDTFGVRRDDGRPPDHLSVLLEFLVLLIETGQGQVIGLFCADHLDWLGALTAQARLLGVGSVFTEVLAATECLVESVANTNMENTNV